MTRLIRTIVAALFCCVFAPILVAQVKPGQYANGSFDTRGFDTINLGSLNVMAAIPIINKPGRGGTNFTYTLAYNGAVWYPAPVNGVQTFVNTQGWGWQGQTEVATGYVSENQQLGFCFIGTTRVPQTTILDVIYYDTFGGSHRFGGHKQTSPCPSNTDTLTNSWSADGRYQYTIYGLKDRHGNNINAPTFTAAPAGYTTASYTDTNGNEISIDASGNFTDTMGMKVLSVSGTAPNSVTMSFTDAGGVARTATIDYTNYTVKTNALCSGVVDASMSNVPLVSSITMADGSSYEFTYEETPGISSAVTGRVASITLPTGGTISYAYHGGNNGSGMVCADGSTSAITRTATTDTGSSVWTYVRTASTNRTLVTDGLGNQTDMYFVQPSTGGEPAEYYETSRSVYNGVVGGTPLVALQTCHYPAAQGACGSTALTLPITQIDTYSAPDGGAMAGATVKFNTYGLETERDTYDFGSATARGGLLEKELWNYPTSGIVNLISSYQVYDAWNNMASQTVYTYDTGTLTTTSGLPQHVAASGPRGNMTAVTRYADASHFVYMDYLYDDAGTVRQTIGSNGQTNFTSFDSTDTFTTGTTLPSTPNGIALTQGAAYDSNTGVPTSTTDPNGFQTVATDFDPLSRPQQINYPDGGHAYIVHNPSYTIVTHDVDSSGARTDNHTHFDPYGRTDRLAQQNGQGTNPWYQVDTCFDANGNASFQSVRFQGAGWGVAKNCSGTGNSTIYDALGRVTRVTHADGSYAQYSYHGRATQFTDENGVSRIMQVDGLGRIATVCEISATAMSGDSPAACNLDIAGTGFLTQYSYSTNNTTTITQGLQTRVLQTDWLGRLTSIQQPEVGGAVEPTTFSYSYNSTGLQVVRMRPKANSGSPTALTTTTTQYDALGRILSVTYDDGTPTKQFSYDDANYLNAPQVHRVNVKGRPSTAMTYVPNTTDMLSGIQYSYDAVGRVTEMWECGSAATCGNGALARDLAFSYDYAGRLTQQVDPTAGGISYGLSLAGEITSITNTVYNNATNPSALVSNVQNGPLGPTSYKLGNGLTTVMTYDPPTNSQFRWLCAGGVTTSFCTGGTQLYGIYALWKGNYLVNGIDTIENTGGNYTYDALGHMTAYTGTQGQPTSYSYTYDRYGNRLSATPGANITINKGNNIIQEAGFYNDAAGNETNDSVHSYAYDAEYNLTSVDGGSTATYFYNALNQRVEISNAQGSHEFTYDVLGRRVTTWLPGTNTGIQGQIWWGSTPIAYRDIDGSTYFQHGDWLGTQRLLTNYSGSVVSTYISRPWGEAYASTGKDDNISHYAGLAQSENTGIQHAQFRDYDSSLGRWLGPDSYTGSYDFSNPQSFNRFTYALNQPVSATDSLGLVKMPVPEPGGGGGSDCWWCGIWPVLPGGPTPPQQPQQPPMGPGKGGSKDKGSPPKIDNGVDRSIANEYSAYNACVGDRELEMPEPPEVEPPEGGAGENPGPGDFGVVPGEWAPNVGPLNNDLTIATMQSCLRQHPLAALDPSFNDIQPADAYPISFF